MSIAVVTALYNGAPWIGETLASVAAQTRAPAEHWVIDDRSTDGSSEIVAGHGGLKLHANPGKGPNPARAFAITETRAEYIAVLDQDDLWHPQHLELLASVLEKHPETPAAFTGAQRFYTGETVHYRPRTDAPTPFDPWERFPMNAIAAPAQVLIRRDALLAAGGWPTHIVGVADAFMWMRLSVSQPLLSLPALTVGYRQHEQSYSKTLRRSQAGTYFSRLMSASAEALRAREAAGNEITAHSNRLELFRLMFEWLGTEETKSAHTEKRKIASDLDAALTKHSSSQATELWSQVFYFTAPVSSKMSAITRAWWLLQLYARAPHSTQNLRRSLRAVIAHNLQIAAQKFHLR